MQTIVQKMDRNNLRPEDFEKAVELLRSGQLVAMPTETVYGLAGNAFDSEAARKIYAAKGRPSDNPLIVHIADIEALNEIAGDVPDIALKVAEKFWPGPLTMILKKSSRVPKETTGGLDTVAIRFPSDKIANMLISQSGLYLAAPSANASGRPSTTRAEHVYEDLNGKIPLILDGGSCKIGLESTIIDLSADKPQILRPGYITLEMLKEAVPGIEYDPAVISRTPQKDVVAKAPGMKYRHYAPKGNLTIIEGEKNKVIENINRLAALKINGKYCTGIIATEETAPFYNGIQVNEKSDFANMKNNAAGPLIFTVGSDTDDLLTAVQLFDRLRLCDEAGCAYIYSEGFENGPLSQAIMNRLLKAAGYQVETV